MIFCEKYSITRGDSLGTRGRIAVSTAELFALVSMDDIDLELWMGTKKGKR